MPTVFRMRLQRLTWVFENFPIYFVTAITHDRTRVLNRPLVQEALEKFAFNGTERGAWLGAYVLMPDHLHAFVALDAREIDLSTWMKAMKNILSKALREDGVEAPHWQKGFFDHVLRDAESYAQKWHYVRDNPVRAGLAPKWEDWIYRGEPYPLEARERWR